MPFIVSTFVPITRGFIVSTSLRLYLASGKIDLPLEVIVVNALDKQRVLAITRD